MLTTRIAVHRVLDGRQSGEGFERAGVSSPNRRKDIEMKSIRALLAIVAVSFVTSVFAQDSVPPPSLGLSPSPAIEETPSASVETTPAPTPEATASPSREEKPSTTITTEAKEKSSSSAASPAAAKKKAATSETSKKYVMTPDKGSPESVVKRLENEWMTSIKDHDASFLEARVANDFTAYSSKGKLLNKSALLKQFKNDKDTYTTAKNRGVTVRGFGSNVAVAHGTSIEAGKDKGGKAFKKTFRWTDTWMLRGKNWQCIASHVTLEAQK